LTPLIASPKFLRVLQPLIGAALLVIAHVALLVIFDLAARPAITFVWLSVAFLGLFLADRYLVRVERPSVTGILLVATLLRLLFVPLPPTLSNDILRYEWDGRVFAAGFNPYALAPESTELEGLRDEVWEEMHHKNIPTVYPPVALSLFTLASRMPSPQIAIKVVLCVLDLMSCWLLVVLARRTGVPISRTIWYAWNPVITLELAGMGHVDALAITATLTAVACLVDRSPRSSRAGLAAAAGVLAKIVPLTTLLLWLRTSPRPWRFGVAAGTVIILASAPVLLATGGVPPGLVKYGVSWEFNGPLFEPLWRSLEFLHVPALFVAVIDQLKVWSGEVALLNQAYPLIYPQFIAKVLLGIVLLAVIVLTSLRSEVIPGTARIFGWILLCSATVYPWYLLWVLPWAALLRHPPWLMLSGLILLTYVPGLFSMNLWPWIYLAIWLPFVLIHYWFPRWSID
jgi:hypothetical protein